MSTCQTWRCGEDHLHSRRRLRAELRARDPYTPLSSECQKPSAAARPIGPPPPWPHSIGRAGHAIIPRGDVLAFWRSLSCIGCRCIVPHSGATAPTLGAPAMSLPAWLTGLKGLVPDFIGHAEDRLKKSVQERLEEFDENLTNGLPQAPGRKASSPGVAQHLMWRGISACKEPHASHQSLRCLRRISSPSHRVLARTAGRVGDNARSPFPSLRCDAWPTWSGEALTFHFDPHAERSCCACAGWQSAAHCVWTRSAHPCPCFALTRTSVLDAGCPPQQTRRQRPSWNTTRKRSSFPSTKRRMKKSSLQ